VSGVSGGKVAGVSLLVVCSAFSRSSGSREGLRDSGVGLLSYTSSEGRM
jgi:hypothetical protein